MTSIDGCQRVAGRVDALRATELVTSPQAFDRLARLTCRLLQASTALISLVTADRQILMGAHGLPEPWVSSRQKPLSHSICKHVVTGSVPLIIADARIHPLVRDNPAVHQLLAVAYLGVPLLGPGGEIVGAVCAIDSTPRDWSEDDIETLSVLSQAVTSEIGAHLYRQERDRSEQARRAGEARSTEILAWSRSDLGRQCASARRGTGGAWDPNARPLSVELGLVDQTLSPVARRAGEAQRPAHERAAALTGTVRPTL